MRLNTTDGIQKRNLDCRITDRGRETEREKDLSRFLSCRIGKGKRKISGGFGAADSSKLTRGREEGDHGSYCGRGQVEVRGGGREQWAGVGVDGREQGNKRAEG